MSEIKKVSADVVIFGGGITGLVVADMLSAQGKRIFLIEKTSHLGGLARTEQHNGFYYDLGGHRIYFRNDDTISYMRGLLPEIEWLSLRRKSQIYFRDRYIDYPISIKSLWKFEKALFMKILIEHMTQWRKPRLQNSTLEAWLLHHYGTILYETFFKEYSEKVWGVPCSQLSSQWADRRIGKNTIREFVKLALRMKGTIKENSLFFYYPRKGMGQLIRALEERIVRNNTIVTNGTISSLTRKEGRITGVHVATKQSHYVIDCKAIVSTIPPEECVSYIDSTGNSVKSCRGEKEYRDLIIVGLVLNTSRIAHWHWCYYPGSSLLISRVYEPSFWSPALTPDQTKTLVCAEIFCSVGDSTWESDDRKLIERVYNESLMVNLVRPELALLDSFVHRIEKAYPLHIEGNETYMRGIMKRLTRETNLYCAGRTGTHNYYDMEECIDDARSVVSNVMTREK